MKKHNFNEGWFVRNAKEEEFQKVTIPHDAMIHEKRSLKSRGEHNIGWFEAQDYVYQKKFTLPEEEQGKKIVFEFEGVYHDAEVYMNGKKAAYRPYGYTNFFVDATEYLQEGENELRVLAKNSDQPNSRWYSGTGIYRPVWMYTGKQKSIAVNGVMVRTVSIDREERSAELEVTVRTLAAGNVLIVIRNDRGEMAVSGNIKCETQSEGQFTGSTRFTIRNAQLWNVDTPVLYTCEAVLEEDKVEEKFGVRKIEWNEMVGFQVNGERVILRGACIHHDNGVLGACTYPEAEERRVRILKENGYNAIRCAHNPCSKALLDACDKLGMLVMDEYVDMWYIHKNQYDYALHMREWWKQDLRDMVEKDYNHPCVVLYSTGNEVAETGEKEGIALTGQMTEYLHSLDDSRPVTCGINIFFNLLYAMGFGVYSDEKAKKESEKPGKKKKVGSEFYNTLAGMFGDKSMKLGAALHLCDLKTRDAYANMDVAGYNYGIYRYRHDLRKYPKRLILGSETFCSDAYSFYELAKKEKRLIGDFVWAGMDYLGECGIGSWEYEDHAPKESQDAGWLTAGSGRINILGYPLGEAAYTKVALGQEKGPLLAVRPVYQIGTHTPSAWKMTDALTSWSWQGCDGIRATVEVYARAAAVELLLNGKKAGKKKLKNTCRTSFQIPYEDGTLTAVSYDVDGREIGRCELKTAQKDTMLSVLPEKETALPKELQYIELRYTDSQGIWKPMEKHRIKIQVENGELMGFGNACPYNKDGYDKEETRTYYGEALAVVRAGESGSVKVSVQDEASEYSVDIPIQP